MPYAEIRVGHVRCDLLMARRNQCDAVARLIKRIKNANIPVTTESKNVWDFAFDQILDNDIGTLHARHRWRPSLLKSLAIMRERFLPYRLAPTTWAGEGTFLQKRSTTRLT